MKPLDYIVDGILAILVMFLFTLLYFGLKQDSMVETLVHTDTSDFVESVRSRGYLTKDMYDNFLDQLSSTGLMYDVELEHRQLVCEPKYRMRTAEEIINERDSAFNGINSYHYFDVKTDTPVVSDPIYTGNLNTETNESILAKAINAPSNSNHIHTDNCNDGSGLKGPVSVYCASYTPPMDSQGHYNGYPCPYTNYYVGIKCNNCGTLLYSLEYYDYYNDTNSFGYMLDGYASQFGHYEDYYSITYNYPAKYATYIGQAYAYDVTRNLYAETNWNTRFWYVFTDNYNGNTKVYYALNPTNIANMNSMKSFISTITSKIGCIKLDRTISFPGEIEYLINSSDFKNYGKLEMEVPVIGYDGCRFCGSQPLCGSVVTSISPTNPTQTVYRGDDIISTVIAAYLDGSTKTIVTTVSGFDKNKIGTQTVTLTYTGLVDNAKTIGSKSCTIFVTVIPRSKTCANGHTYNLNANGSDPGCPYCKAWLKSLIVKEPATGTISIYRGTSLKQNGVTLHATYMNGYTELVTDKYIDNLDKNYVGSQNVTLSYKGQYTHMTVIVKRNIVKCTVCGRYYELHPDDSDPGCPYCAARTPMFTGNIMEYYNRKYEEDILKELYHGSGIYYFSRYDYLSIKLQNNSRSLGGKLTAAFYKSLADGNIRTQDGGYIRQSGQ